MTYEHSPFIFLSGCWIIGFIIGFLPGVFDYSITTNVWCAGGSILAAILVVPLWMKFLSWIERK